MKIPNKNIISLASSLGQLLTGWRFAQFSQQVIAPYVKRYALMYTTFAVQWYSKSITGDLLCHMQLKI